MKIYSDQLGNSHVFEKIPSRIVSLVPSQTELLYDLGLEDSIVGITKFCVHPFHLKSTKTIVGGTKNIKFDKIKVLNPDIIIANKEESTKEIVEQLSQICPVWVTDIFSIEDNLKMIQDFGQIFNKPVEAQKWIDNINGAHHDFQNFIKEKQTKKVAYFIWANPYMVAGNDTFINEMLLLNRFENVFQNKNRYPEIRLEDIPTNLDIVLLSSEPFPFDESHANQIKEFSIAEIRFVDGEMFSWYGSRVVKAFDYFMELHS